MSYAIHRMFKEVSLEMQLTEFMRINSLQGLQI